MADGFGLARAALHRLHADQLEPFADQRPFARTPDPYVPNVVRYQLRYIPIAFEKWCHQESNLLFRFILIP